MKRVAATILALGVMGHAHALTGNQLHQMMQDRDPSAALVVSAYMRGVVDAMSFTKGLYKPGPNGKMVLANFYCTPPGVTLEQASDVVRNYLATDVASRHLDATVLAVLAMSRAWPCAANQP